MDEISSIALTLTLSAITGYLLKRINMLSLPGYILSGLLGYYFFSFNISDPIVSFMSSIAVPIISFEIGLSIDFNVLRKLLTRSIIVIALESMIVFYVIFIVSLLINMSFYERIIISLIGLNSSTAIAFKLLEEKGKINRENESIKMVLAVASLEDIAALISLALVSILIGQEVNLLSYSAKLLGASLFSFVLGYLVSRETIPRITKGGEELLISFLFGIVMLFTLLSNNLNLPSALGAFILGLSVSLASKESEEIIKTIKPLRYLVSIFFFTSIGSVLGSSPSFSYLLLGIILSIIIPISKMASFFISSWISGIDRFTSLRLSLYMGAISEIGIIISQTAFLNGLVGPQIVYSSVLIVAISSIMDSFIVNYEEKVASIIGKRLSYRWMDQLENSLNSLIRKITAGEGKRKELMLILRPWIQILFLFISTQAVNLIFSGLQLDGFLKNLIIMTVTVTGSLSIIYLIYRSKNNIFKFVNDRSIAIKHRNFLGNLIYYISLIISIAVVSILIVSSISYLEIPNLGIIPGSIIILFNLLVAVIIARFIIRSMRKIYKE
jgi:Kef-type K+ transport system membrane component KefB